MMHYLERNFPLESITDQIDCVELHDSFAASIFGRNLVKKQHHFTILHGGCSG